jgi:microcystin-dependent protein
MKQIIGQIKLFAGNKVPNGWLSCDGQLLDIVDYPLLFSVIGTTYDPVAPEGQFRLPDARGRALVSVGLGDGLTNRNLGEIFGDESSIVRSGDMPHSHALLHAAEPPTDGIIVDGSLPATSLGYTVKDTLYALSRTLNIGSLQQITDAGLPHNNMQPYSVINLLICIHGYLE